MTKMEEEPGGEEADQAGSTRLFQRLSALDPFAAASFLVPFLAYVLTLGPSVFWLDSGIYLAAARELGIAYPPGFPLYVLFTWAFGHLPLGTFAETLHVFSALAGAGACLVTYWTVRRLSEGLFGGGTENRIAALLTAVSFGFSTALWSQAVNAEVYSLQALLTALTLLALLRLEEDPEASWRRRLLPLAGVAGLGFANHPMVVGLLPALMLAVWRHRRLRSSWLKALPVFLLAGFLPYLYIPFRSMANPLTDWGDAETAGNFFRLVTASHWTGESSSFSFFGAGFFERVGQALHLFALQFWLLGLGLGLWGFAILLRRRSRGFGLSCLLIGISALLIPLFYYQTKEFESWFLPAYQVFFLAFGAGTLWVLARLRTRGSRRGWRWAVLALVALLVPGLLLGTALPAVNRSGDWDARDYGVNILESVDARGILFISGDNPSSTVLYAQAVEEIRRDVTVVNLEALQSPWYRGHVRKNLNLSLGEPPPDLEHSPLLVSELALELLRRHGDRPVFCLMPSHLRLPGSVRVTPWGMVFRLSECDVTPRPSAWDFKFRSPSALTRVRAADQREKINEAVSEMQAGYYRAWSGGGMYYFERKDFRSAADLLEPAVALAPDNEELALRLGVSLIQTGEQRKALEVFRDLVRHEPRSFYGYYNLGNVLEETGDRAGARDAYRRAVEIRPDFDLARQALHALR